MGDTHKQRNHTLSTPTAYTETSSSPILLSDKVDPVFLEVKDKEGLSGWLMRAYFSPEKHAGQTYFKPTVTKENVLEFISDRGNQFPQRPGAVADLWKMLPGLRNSLKSVVLDDEKPKEAINIIAERPLIDICTVFGCSKTAVHHISDKATTKLTVLTRALGGDRAVEVKKTLDEAYMTAVEMFADSLQEFSTPDQIVEHLISTEAISAFDKEVLDDTERDGIESLIMWIQDSAPTQSEIEDILTEDLEKPVNLFNLLQTMIARKVFPVRKGRPPKNASKTGLFDFSDNN